MKNLIKHIRSFFSPSSKEKRLVSEEIEEVPKEPTIAEKIKKVKDKTAQEITFLEEEVAPIIATEETTEEPTEEVGGDIATEETTEEPTEPPPKEKSKIGGKYGKLGTSLEVEVDDREYYVETVLRPVFERILDKADVGPAMTKMKKIEKAVANIVEAEDSLTVLENLFEIKKTVDELYDLAEIKISSKMKDKEEPEVKEEGEKKSFDVSKMGT